MSFFFSSFSGDAIDSCILACFACIFWVAPVVPMAWYRLHCMPPEPLVNPLTSSSGSWAGRKPRATSFVYPVKDYLFGTFGSCYLIFLASLRAEYFSFMFNYLSLPLRKINSGLALLSILLPTARGGNVFTGVCLSTIGLMTTRSLPVLVAARSVRILLECFLVLSCNCHLLF